MIRVLLPTLYGFRDPNYLVPVADSLIRQLDSSGQKYSVTVYGRNNKLYNDFKNDRVTKEYLDGNEGIHFLRAFNREIAKADPEDFICLFHDDLFIDCNGWVNMFVDIYNHEPLKCGILGVLSHSQSFIKYVSHNLYQMTYTNGNLFAKAKNLTVQHEELSEECGDLDLCYEQMYNGRKNYLVGIPYRHYMTPYSVTFSYLGDYKKTIGECRKFFNEKWSKRIPNNDLSKYI